MRCWYNVPGVRYGTIRNDGEISQGVSPYGVGKKGNIRLTATTSGGLANIDRFDYTY
ncbi:MAG: hypothetical protein JXA18_10465 [Chitinispirillaceae bacterium]|nr:hypothetical protein [Chitinispirillaceae bacterium]